MRYGIVSDIHANIQAWNAVLSDMKKMGVDSILCLGDVVGYGPNPVEVMDSCYKHCDYFILGNHDAVIGNRLDSNLFNDNAKFLIEWTREQLSPLAADFFGDMPLRMEGPSFLCAHGELALPGRFGYIYEAQDAIESFTSNDSPLMFVGHTHFPTKFTYDLLSNQVTKDSDVDFKLNPGQRYMVNAGSVGDPRDGHVTASYCVYDAETQEVFFRKVPFDVNGFRENLIKTQLPVNPFFLRVLDGQTNETETIKDMQTLEKSAAAKPLPKIQKIGQESSGKKKRQKLSFSSDTLAETRQMSTQSGRRTEEKSSVDKTKKLIGIIAGVFVLLLIVVIIVIRQSMASKEVASAAETKPKQVEESVEIVEEKPIVQFPGKDLDLDLESAKYPISLLINETSGLLEGWSNLDDKISWKIRITTPGWYELQLENSKSNGNAEIQGRIGEVDVQGKIEANSEVNFSPLGQFEIKRSFTGNLSLSCLSKADDDNILSLKSVKLKYLGKEKPRNKVPVEDEVLTDFEELNFPPGWITRGVAFGYQPITTKTLFAGAKVQGVSGKGLIGTAQRFYENREAADKAEGLLFSPEFELKHDYINFLAGASGTNKDLILLSVNGKPLAHMALPKMQNGKLVSAHWDVKEHLGKKVQIIIKDGSEKSVFIDRIILTDKDQSKFSAAQVNGTVIGDPLRSVEEQSASQLKNAANKLYLKDLDGAIEVLKTAKVDQAYISAVESLKGFKQKVMNSYKEFEGKIINDFVGRAAGMKYKVQIVSASDSELKMRAVIGGSAKQVSLNFNQLSMEEVQKRAEGIENGDAAYLIFSGALTKGSEQQFDVQNTQLSELMNLITKKSKSSLKANVISGSCIKIILENKKEIKSFKIKVHSGTSTRDVEAKYEDITELIPKFNRDGYTNVEPMKVAVFNLPGMLNLNKIHLSGRGDLKVFSILVLDDEGNIVWQESIWNPKSVFAKKSFEVQFKELLNQPPAENLARNVSFETSDKSSNGYGLVDGIWAGRAPFSFSTGNSETFPKEVTLDLEENVLANAVRLGSHKKSATYKLQVSISSDGKNFKNIGKISRVEEKDYRYTLHFKEQEIRYVKVKFVENFKKGFGLDKNKCFLNELEVFRFE